MSSSPACPRFALVAALACALLSPIRARGGDTAVRGEAVDAAEVTIVEHSAYWTDVLGAVSSLDGANLGNQQPLLFVIRGTLRNASPAPLHHVLLAFEVLDRDGNVVAVEKGYNRRAETLRPIDSPFPMLDDSRPIEPIAGGDTDTFRMILVGPDTPPFASYRIRVLAAPAGE